MKVVVTNRRTERDGSEVWRVELRDTDFPVIAGFGSNREMALQDLRASVSIELDGAIGLLAPEPRPCDRCDGKMTKVSAGDQLYWLCPVGHTARREP